MILFICPYGSHVYGTATESSDEDILVVTDRKELWEKYQKPYDTNAYRIESKDFHVYSKEEWIQELRKGTEFAYEITNTPANLKRSSYDFSPYLQTDKTKVCHEFSQKASNSFVKAKKKLTIEIERHPEEKESLIYTGKKSLWHSLKILTFAEELWRTGKITLKNPKLIQLYWEIMQDSCDWNELKQKYQPMYNLLHHEWKKQREPD